MKDTKKYVGLDVSKEKIAVAIAEGQKEAKVSEGKRSKYNLMAFGLVFFFNGNFIVASLRLYG